MTTKLVFVRYICEKNLESLRTFLENSGFERLSLLKLSTGHYRLSLEVNGQTGQFILDTGASSSCIGFESVPYFNLFSENTEIKAAGAGAINMETKMAHNNTLKIGSLVFRKLSFVLFDMTHVNEALAQANELPVHGILGADFLKKRRAVIDYGRNCAYFKR